MLSISHHRDDLREKLEVVLLLGSELVLVEELRYLLEVIETSNSVILAVTMVLLDASKPEVISDLFQEFFVTFVLNDPELRKHLPAEAHLWHPIDANIETAFSIGEADYPLRIQAFLLIVCTHHIITVELSPEKDLLALLVVWDTCGVFLRTPLGFRKLKPSEVPAYSQRKAVVSATLSS